MAKVGESFTNLIERISIVLGYDERQKNFAKKALRELYDLRSAFVHGGFKIHHPMQSDVMDNRLDEDYAKIYNACEIGFMLLVASIQAFIEKDSLGFKFQRK